MKLLRKVEIDITGFKKIPEVVFPPPKKKNQSETFFNCLLICI